MKVVLIGAWSAFGSRISVDILSREPLADSTIALCDIDTDKLETVHANVQKVIDGNDLPGRVVSNMDRREVLPNADFMVLSVSIGGPAYYDEPYESEMAIPRRYGVVQTVGDTVAPAGFSGRCAPHPNSWRWSWTSTSWRRGRSSSTTPTPWQCSRGF